MNPMSHSPQTATPVAADAAAVIPSSQVAALLRQARLRIEALEAQAHAPIAVVGMGCRFPGGANTPAAFWQNLINGQDAITPAPLARGEPTSTMRGAEQPRAWGGFLADIDHFDASFFAISGREAPAIDPQQRLLLETAWEAVEGAGIDPTTLAGSQTGVFIGISSNDYSRLQQRLGIGVTPYSGTGNALSIAANRISYLFDLHGPSLAIDTACSSALVAVHHACQSLRRGECVGALVGGVNLILDPELTTIFSQAGMLAADGRSKVFDARADGYVRSEGAGMVYLKRLADAQQDGDPILAVLHGTAINQDGRSNGLTAPNGLAQQRVIRAALQDAGLVPAQISYVETHGTGTALGDPIEVNALKAVLLAGRTADQPCWLGAVKANIGHLEAAAGMAGLIKAVLCLQHEQIPGQLHVTAINPYITLTGTPLAIPTTSQPWPAGATTRYAGVSAFGFGGANAHVILGEAPALPAVAQPARPAQLFTLAAPSEVALTRMAQSYATALATVPTDALADLAFTVTTGRTHFAQRLAVVTADVEQLRAQLAAFAAGESTTVLSRGGRAEAEPPPLTFLFTGQGAQSAAMGRQLYATAPIFRQAIEQCDALAQPLLGASLVELLYADDATQPARLHQTQYTQPALFAVEYALAQLWLSWEIKPTYVLGHSLGEVVAACVAGALPLAAALPFVIERARLMQRLPANGAMAAIFADEATVSQLLQPVADQVALAAVNGPDHCVISGERQALASLLARFAAAGIHHQALTVSHAFHSPLLAPMLEPLATAAAALPVQPLQIGLITNLTGELLPAGSTFAPGYWVAQARQPVRFLAGLRTLATLGCQHFVELGPKPVLGSIGKRHFDAGSHWLPSLNPPEEEWKTLLTSLAHLYTQGFTVQWAALHAEQPRRRLALPTYPFQRKRYWLPEGSHAMYTNGHSTATPVAPPAPVSTGVSATTTTRQQVILDELRTLTASLLQVAAADLAPHRALVELGADSLVLVEATRQLDARYGVKIALRRFFDDLATLNALAAHLDALLPADWQPATVTPPAPQQVDAPVHGEITAASVAHTPSPSPIPLALSTTQQLLTIVTQQLELLNRYDLSALALTQLANPAPTTPVQSPLPQHAPVAPRQAAPAPSAAPVVIPLTEAQQQLWFLSQLSDEGLRAYNEVVSVQLTGDLDLIALQHGVQQLVQRHGALRTVIDPGGESQTILPTMTTALPVFDFSGLAPAAQASTVTTWLADESCRPVDLAAGPLFRVSLLKRSRTDHLLVMTAHHLIIDGFSMGVLVQELAQLYGAARANRPLTLPPAPQFSDYVTWLSEQFAQGQLDGQAAYWQKQLQGTLPVLELPLDHARPPLQSYRGALATVHVDRGLTTALHQVSRTHGCTLFMTLFAAYLLLLHRLSAQEEIIVGIPAAGRAMPAGERVVGYCAHLLPIRHTLRGNPTFATLLHELRATLLEAYSHQDYPFARLINQLPVSRELSLSPVVGSTFNVTRQPTLPTFPGLTATLGPRPTSFVDHDLGLNIIEHDGALTVDFEYNTDLFDPATVARLAGHFTTLVSALAADPQQPVAMLPLLNVTERQQLLVDWNATAYPFDERAGFHQLFAAQVAQTPTAIAVRYLDQALSYAELDASAEQMATHLRAAGIGVDSLVALLCERSPAFLAAVIAIFKAGGAYLPLDVRAPAARQSQILAQSRTPLLLISADFAITAAEALARLPGDQQPQVIDLAALQAPVQVPAAVVAAPEPSDNIGARLAYVIYTSGSTGLPKGAMVEQRGMINHLYAKIKDLGMTADDSVAQTAPQSFDISVWQFLSALVIGGCVHIFPDEVAADPVALLEQTATEQITILEVVPSLLRMMVDALAQGLAVDLQRLRWMIPTGEALPPNLARQWLRLCPPIPLVNAYGPTECSDDVTHYFVTEPPDATVVNMPIGRPIINMRMYILDAHRQPVPIGVAGELYVGGIGVGRGYLYDPERTAAAFIPDPFSADPTARLYKTGDKARYLPDGNIEYLGRLDYQVKIRGFRIELGEIEALLEQHSGVYQAVVLDQPDPTGSKRLVAYVVPTSDLATAPPAAELRRFLNTKLPDYMVPAAFILLESLPLTPNGKLDRKSLTAPAAALWGGEADYRAPTTPLESELVTIWAEVLKVAPTTIGTQHNFFELGGHSLLAIQIIARVRTRFQIELPIRTLMEMPTVAGMATAIQNHRYLTELLPSSDPSASLAVVSDPTHEVIDL